MESTLTTYSQMDDAEGVDSDEDEGGARSGPGDAARTGKDEDAVAMLPTFGRRDNRATLDEARRILASTASAGIDVRTLGGVAVALRCHCARWPQPFARGYSDLDLVVRRRGAARLVVALEE